MPGSAEYGYEPRRDDDTVQLVNCPFHDLAQKHTELVCGMNLALLNAVVNETREDEAVASLNPAPGRCCVVLNVADTRPWTSTNCPVNSTRCT